MTNSGRSSAEGVPAEPDVVTTKTGPRVQTLHPEGKQGVNIDADKYRVMRQALLLTIPAREDGMLLKDVTEEIRPHLAAGGFDPKASVLWYLTAVKQDLEARGLIEIVPKQSPQRLRLTRRPG